MKKELFAELMQSVGEAVEHARGKRELRTTVLPDAPAVMNAEDIRALRGALNASQAVFAHYLNVSTQLVQAWEANRRRPDGAALRLLSIGRRAPSVVFPGLARFAGAEVQLPGTSRSNVKSSGLPTKTRTRRQARARKR